MLGWRILTAAVLAVAFTGALFLAPRPLWLALCAAALAAAGWEWGRLARLTAAWNAVLTAGLVAALAALDAVRTAPLDTAMYALSMLFWVIAAPVWLWKRPRLMPRAALALAAVVVLLPAFAALTDLRSESAALALAVMGVVWVSDTAAYFTGRRFGRRKLAPAISPGKTWEGAWGAAIAVAAYALVWQALPQAALPRGEWGQPAWLVATALFFAILGIVGDLLESQLKRDAGVKDSGRLLPGHGGVLDRIDALLPVLPAAAWMFAR